MTDSMPRNNNLFLRRVKSECIILNYSGIMDMDFVPTQSINGCTWTVADLCFPKLAEEFYLNHIHIIDNIMYCDYNRATVIAEHVKGWHLPTLQDCKKLVTILNDNNCFYKVFNSRSTQFHKYRISNYGHEIYTFGNDCDFNAQFNGYMEW